MVFVQDDTKVSVTLVEEIWWEARPDAVHAKVYRCNAGKWNGKYGVNLHTHAMNGGAILIHGGWPDFENFVWDDDKEAAVSKALAKLASHA